MMIEDSPANPAAVRDARADDGEPGDGDGAGFPFVVDRISQLRHDLRNPVNQILGYGELLIEESAQAGRPAPLGGLRSIIAGGKRVVALIDEGLSARGEGQGEAAIDLPALRLRLLEPLGRIIADCDDLTREASDPEQADFRKDVARIRAGASRLLELADEMLAGPRPRPEEGTPAP
jgi:adenylate cyclase